MSIRQQVKEKLTELSDKAKALEALQNEVDALAVPDSLLHTTDPTIIKGTTKRKNIQKMIKDVVQAEYTAILSEIDESPAKAFTHFNYGKLNDDQKQIFRDMIIDARKAEIDTVKQQLKDKLDITF